MSNINFETINQFSSKINNSLSEKNNEFSDFKDALRNKHRYSVVYFWINLIFSVLLSFQFGLFFNKNLLVNLINNENVRDIVFYVTITFSVCPLSYYLRRLLNIIGAFDGVYSQINKQIRKSKKAFPKTSLALNELVKFRLKKYFLLDFTSPLIIVLSGYYVSVLDISMLVVIFIAYILYIFICAQFLKKHYSRDIKILKTYEVLPADLLNGTKSCIIDDFQVFYSSKNYCYYIKKDLWSEAVLVINRDEYLESKTIIAFSKELITFYGWLKDNKKEDKDIIDKNIKNLNDTIKEFTKFIELFEQ